MPESQFVNPEKIASRPGFLKNIIQNWRIQSKEEGMDGFSRVIWEIPVKTVPEKPFDNKFLSW